MIEIRIQDQQRDLRATVDGIMDPRAGLSTAPFPLSPTSQADWQTGRLADCVHAAMPPHEADNSVCTTWSGLT